MENFAEKNCLRLKNITFATLIFKNSARMAELVDALVSKTSSFLECRFDPGSGYKGIKLSWCLFLFWMGGFNSIISFAGRVRYRIHIRMTMVKIVFLFYSLTCCLNLPLRYAGNPLPGFRVAENFPEALKFLWIKVYRFFCFTNDCITTSFLRVNFQHPIRSSHTCSTLYPWQ